MAIKYRFACGQVPLTILIRPVMDNLGDFGPPAPLRHRHREIPGSEGGLLETPLTPPLLWGQRTVSWNTISAKGRPGMRRNEEGRAEGDRFVVSS